MTIKILFLMIGINLARVFKDTEKDENIGEQEVGEELNVAVY